ncbi:MAG TPA: response regulator transcription factor [Mycobacteriales bacterium]|jgi:DNA-binding response OmpR family regulator|nr:response regulator transcription factor [Mycobacteriales bacterium]
MVVEADPNAGVLLESALVAPDRDVLLVPTAAAALRAAARTPYDLILLGAPGPQVCSRLRMSQPGAVLVVLSAGGDVIAALAAGADDYLTAPLRAAELAARIDAHLRRGRAPSTPAVGSVGPLTVDVTAHRCLLGGQEVRLRPKEFDLLARLAAEPGTAVRRETLMADVWQENWFGSTRTLDVHVGWIRRRLREAAGRASVPPVRITTVRGHGFRLEC